MSEPDAGRKGKTAYFAQGDKFATAEVRFSSEEAARRLLDRTLKTREGGASSLVHGVVNISCMNLGVAASGGGLLGNGGPVYWSRQDEYLVILQDNCIKMAQPNNWGP